jgi:glycosyltransferase involved in cell wall biosynthesis
MSLPLHARAAAGAEADVCLIVEGCYPYVSGGVANWLDWLIRSLPEIRFAVMAVVADDRPMTSRYELPPNVVAYQDVPLAVSSAKPNTLPEPALDAGRFCDLICRVIEGGDLAAFAELCDLVSRPPAAASAKWRFGAPAEAPSLLQLMNSRFGWKVMVEAYARLAPQASFPDFFWAWRTLVGGLYAVLKAPLPRARAYHTISTGYAGLLAARAAVVTRRAAAITEHGIYTNERRIDLTMAEWIPDSIAPSLGRIDDRVDLRQFWIRSFEAYARLCYGACSRITTLYGENQSFQLALGAPTSKLEVIPNGINMARFAGLERLPDRPPTVALIGRVVPIKDIKTYIAAVARLKVSIPNVRALLLGPTDEDPDYNEQCQQMVRELGLRDTFVFTGKVNIIDWLPQIDVMALTSISEAQPLVLLEAGAAAIPCVTTDVGSCREIIEGLPEESPRLGPAGRVVRPMDAEAAAEALRELLADPELRRACGERLRERVRLYFTSEASSARYAALYSGLMAA